MRFSELQALIYKEFLLEWRQKNSLFGIAVYIISSVFLCYFAFQGLIDIKTFNALFWIIVLFTAVNSVSRSFMQESDERLLYYYQLTSPQGIILSKMIYNSLLMLVLTSLAFSAYVLFMGQEVALNGWLFTAVILGSLGFGSILSLVSAIASKTGNNPSIMALLSFPVILPFLKILIEFSANALQGIQSDNNMNLATILVSINAMVIALGYLLFPYLWRD